MGYGKDCNDSDHFFFFFFLTVLYLSKTSLEVVYQRVCSFLWKPQKASYFFFFKHMHTPNDLVTHSICVSL